MDQFKASKSYGQSRSTSGKALTISAPSSSRHVAGSRAAQSLIDVQSRSVQRTLPVKPAETSRGKPSWLSSNHPHPLRSHPVTAEEKEHASSVNHLTNPTRYSRRPTLTSVPEEEDSPPVPMTPSNDLYGAVPALSRHRRRHPATVDGVATRSSRRRASDVQSEAPMPTALPSPIRRIVDPMNTVKDELDPDLVQSLTAVYNGFDGAKINKRQCQVVEVERRDETRRFRSAPPTYHAGGQDAPAGFF